MSDTRRDQLIDFVEKEFIGPDPVDWPDMVQPNGEEILRSDPPLTRYIAGILYPREAREENIEFSEGEIPIQGSDEENTCEVAPARKTSGDTLEFLEDAEELINRSNAYRQSAMSITVSVKKNDSVRVEVHAGIYKLSTTRIKFSGSGAQSNGIMRELQYSFHRKRKEYADFL